IRALAVGPVGAPDQRARARKLHLVPSAVSLVPHRHGHPGRADHQRSLALPEVRQIRHLDPGHDPGSRDGTGYGDPGAARLHGRLRDRLGDGGGERRPLRSVRGSDADHGVRLHPARVHRGRRRRDGQPRRLDPGLDLRQPARELCGDRRERGASGDRLAPEILIWGLLAMSSDILIGYTGMVSCGHSAFFGLGMYGAAAALLTVKPPSLWLGLVYGLVAAGGAAVFVAYFATRLRDIYFAISTLVFSQIFYVI